VNGDSNTLVTAVQSGADSVLERSPQAKVLLDGALKGNGLSHAYLLCGPSGSGKREIAKWFAGELLASNAVDRASIARRVSSGSHPDLTWVQPSGAHGVLISDVSEAVVTAASRTPFEADYRVFVIESAGTLNDEAANSLLKSLEEPPSYVCFLLLADQAQDVIPTIRSRCQEVRLNRRDPLSVASELEADGVDAGRALVYAELAGGDVAKAKWLASEQGRGLRAAVEKFVVCAVGNSTVDAPWMPFVQLSKAAGEDAADGFKDGLQDQSEYLTGRDLKRFEKDVDERAHRLERRTVTDTVQFSLSLTVTVLRDLLCIKVGVPNRVINSDRSGALAALADKLSVAAVNRMIDLVEQTRSTLNVNVTVELALQSLTYRLIDAAGSGS